ncbi:lysosomal alpha-glucosidase-like [Palaemon carinicauda]|uniref:lysosomal alpha-glucosidase-like n=1 Tax=Palaemon carinicauda TaxID=392227 RepID=UPI0035B68E09
MGKIQLKLPATSPKCVEVHLIPEYIDTPPPTRKKNQWAVNFVGTMMGVGLIMCFLFVYKYGRILSMFRGCNTMFPSKGGGSENTPYLSHQASLERMRSYTNWVKNGNGKKDYGVNFLVWEGNHSLHSAAQQVLEGRKPLPDPVRVQDNKQCSDIPLSLRFDCLPGGTIDQNTCESRGCCWLPAQEIPEQKPFPSPRLHRPTHGTPLEDLPLNVPYCFYPRDYDGYRFVNFSSESYGNSGYLKRETSSGYPHDIPLLKMEVIYETETRIRVKIHDASSSRWESPLPIVPNVELGAAEPLYGIAVEEDDGSFVIFRRASSLPLFDTRNAAPLLYADQFLQLSTNLASEYVYGLGEHLEGLLLDTFWKRRVLWNLDQIPEPGKNTYGSHPFYLSMEPDGNAHGVFILNSNAMDVILQPSPAVTFRIIGGILDLYVFLGPTPNDVISQYTEVIGRPFLPPYWSLGYHQCKFGYKSLNKTKAVWQRTRDAGIPFDVQWNDIDYMEENKDFTYDLIHFRELPEFVQELHQAGMHYVPIVDPGISASEPLHTYPPWDEGLALHVFVRNNSNMPFVGKVWNTATTTWPDFTHPLGTYYWGRQLLRYHSWVEFDGAWIDMNEPSNFWSGSYDGCSSNNLEHPPFLPEVHGGSLYYHTICMSARHYFGNHYSIHNLYGFTEAIATNKALQIVRAKRPFIISRSTFAGQGHYSGHWTGDIWSDWFNMWQSIPGILNFNMFGIPMVGADICGFHGNVTASLCSRWMQLGAFYPFSRNHNSDDTYDQDPVALGKDVVTASRKALEIRYHLLPYLYSLFFKAHLTGEPVARPLFFQFYKDPRTYAIDTQFMWGSGLMIAPVLKENATEVEAYIPEGRWYDWYSKTILEGRGSFEVLTAPNDVIPLLLRGGTVIPVQVPAVTTTMSRKNDMAIIAALDESGHAIGEWFWDDGESLDTAENMNYTHVVFTATPGNVFVNVTLTGYKEPANLGYFHILGVDTDVTAVYVDNKKVSYSYDETTKVLTAVGLKKSLLASFSIIWK